jgi:hypothetical protein
MSTREKFSFCFDVSHFVQQSLACRLGKPRDCNWPWALLGRAQAPMTPMQEFLLSSDLVGVPTLHAFSCIAPSRSRRDHLLDSELGQSGDGSRMNEIQGYAFQCSAEGDKRAFLTLAMLESR